MIKHCVQVERQTNYARGIMKLVDLLQEQAESEPKACPEHQRERTTKIS